MAAMETNTEKQEYTITVYTENQVGLLNRIAIIFSRRKINVESLNTSPSEIAGIHRFTIVISESRDVVIKLVRQIEKQVEVLKTYFNTNDEIVWQELALYKVTSEVISTLELIRKAVDSGDLDKRIAAVSGLVKAGFETDATQSKKSTLKLPSKSV